MDASDGMRHQVREMGPSPIDPPWVIRGSAQVMDLVNITRFLAVMDEATFANAARVCKITPQAVAFSIAKLESELNVKLFERESGGVPKPTTYAAALEVHARGLVIAERRAVEAVKSLRDARSGWIRVGVGETMAGSVIAQVISDIKAERPDVEIALIESYTDVLIKRLVAGEIDLIAGSPVTAMQESENLVQQVLFETRDIMVARSEHPLAGKANVTLQDMRQFTWLVPYARSDTHEAILTTYVEQGIEPPTSFIFSDTATVGFALLRTQDYLILSPPDLITVGEGSQFVKLNAPAPTLKRTACLIYREDQPQSEIAKLVCDRILSLVNSQPDEAARRGARRRRLSAR